MCQYLNHLENEKKLGVTTGRGETSSGGLVDGCCKGRGERKGGGGYARV